MDDLKYQMFKNAVPYIIFKTVVLLTEKMRKAKITVHSSQNKKEIVLIANSRAITMNLNNIFLDTLTTRRDSDSTKPDLNLLDLSYANWKIEKLVKGRVDVAKVLLFEGKDLSEAANKLKDDTKTIEQFDKIKICKVDLPNQKDYGLHSDADQL